MSELLKDLWKDKPLLIAVVVGIGAIIYILIQNQNASSAASTTNSTTGDSSTQTYPVAPAATYVEESYYSPTTTTTTSTSTSTQSVTPTPSSSASTPTLVAPAAIGSLAGTSKSAGVGKSGKADTNAWIYTVPAGSTLLSLAQFAKWGNNWQQLASYRNNAQVLQAAGVNTSNPLAQVPAGLQISV